MKLVRKMIAPTIWLIVLSFVFWGFQSFFLGFKKETLGVGKVFGKLITFKEYQDALRTVEFLLPKPEGNKRSVEEIESTAWQNIILQREAAQEKISVTDEEVLVEVKRLFGDTENFTPAVYETLVYKNFGEQPRAFEERVRGILQIRKLMAAHRTEPKPPADEEVKQYFLNDQNKIGADYIHFPTEKEATDSIAQAKQANFWEEEKKKKDTKANSIGTISLDTLMNMFKVSQSDADYLFNLAENETSKLIAAGNGFALFRVTKKEAAKETGWNDTSKQEYQKRLVDQNKQKAFFEWWGDVMKRADVEKFLKKEETLPSNTNSQ